MLIALGATKWNLEPGMGASTSDCEQYTWPLDGVDVLKYQVVSA